ncbi:MAG: hypothetical protein WCA78_10275 [Rhizomicrobium sp.]
MTLSELRTVALIAVIFGAWCGFPAAAGCMQAKPAAGVVAKISESDGTLYVLRGTEKISVYVTQVVCDGDHIQASGGQGTVGILRADGKIETYGPKAGHNLVHKSSAVSGLWMSILDWANQIAPRVEPYSVMTVGRGGPGEKLAFSIQSLSQKQGRIAVGHDKLYVRWIGGIGPFSLLLADSRGAKSAEVTGIPGHAAYLDAGRNLDVGHWTLTLKDSRGAEAVGEFEVDATRKFEAIDGEPFVEFRTAAAAVKLADDPQWAFEADQMISAAPQQGLDRQTIFKVIACKSYASNPPDDCQ